MKKNLFITAVILFTVLLFIGCSNDSSNEDTSIPATDSYSSLIIGKWQITKTSKPSNYEACDYEGWTNFKSGGSFDDFDECSNYNSGGTWTIKGNSLTFIADDFPISIVSTIKSLTKDTMILLSPDFSGGKIELTYKKI